MSDRDDVEVRSALEQLRDTAAASVEVDRRLDDLQGRSTPSGGARRQGRGLLAAAAVVAVVVGSVAVFARDDAVDVISGPGGADASGVVDIAVVHDPAAKDALDRAVKTTRDAAGFVATIQGGVGPSEFTYEAPDRVDVQTFDSVGDLLSRQVVVGSDMWVSGDGQWVTGQQDWRVTAPFTLFDALTAACVAKADELLLAWDPGPSGCAESAQPSSDLPDETAVWAVEVDDAGRLARVVVGEVGALTSPVLSSVGAESIRSLGRLGASAQLIATFDYDGLPPVTVPPRASADDPIVDGTGIDAERDLSEVVAELGDVVSSCCDGRDDSISFTLASGGNGTLERVAIDPNRPEDTRRGVDDPQFLQLDDGGVVVIAGGDRSNQVLRFACSQFHFTLGMTDTDLNSAVGAATVIASALGCDTPTVGARTECLDHPTDPPACDEGHETGG